MNYKISHRRYQSDFDIRQHLTSLMVGSEDKKTVMVFCKGYEGRMERYRNMAQRMGISNIHFEIDPSANGSTIEFASLYDQESMDAIRGRKYNNVLIVDDMSDEMRNTIQGTFHAANLAMDKLLCAMFFNKSPEFPRKINMRFEDLKNRNYVGLGIIKETVTFQVKEPEIYPVMKDPPHPWVQYMQDMLAPPQWLVEAFTTHFKK